MIAEILIKKTLIIFIVLFFAVVSFSAEEKNLKEIDVITQILNDRTNGTNAFYNKVISPAQSLETDKSKSDRVATVNQKLVSEFSQVIAAFQTASETTKVESVKAAIQNIEPELNKNSGAHVSFVDAIPSAAVSRIVLMIPKINNATSTSVLNTLTSYKRSAKPNDFNHEYVSAQNLTEGAIISNQGSETSWKGSEAAKSFDIGKDFVLKKCRQLLGWRCLTSLYKAESFLSGAEQIKVLFISIYDLTSNPDHSDFSKDKRSTNQITGSTAIYVVKESANWILLYGNDTQWNNGKLSFQGAIQTEFKKDFERLKERLSLDLAIPEDQIK